MSLFSWRKPKPFFTESDNQRMVAAIQNAEHQTSGEVRVFVESRCRFVYAVDRAQEIFFNLNMHQTAERNATLIYLAVKDRQAAVYGDEGIHQKVGSKYWEDIVAKMLLHFRQEKLADGVINGIEDLGKALQFYFPYNQETDKNELPDEIVFGK